MSAGVGGRRESPSFPGLQELKSLLEKHILRVLGWSCPAGLAPGFIRISTLSHPVVPHLQKPEPSVQGNQKRRRGQWGRWRCKRGPEDARRRGEIEICYTTLSMDLSHAVCQRSDPLCGSCPGLGMCMRAAKGRGSAFSLSEAIQGASLTLLHHGWQPGSHRCPFHPHPQLLSSSPGCLWQTGAGGKERAGEKQNKKQTKRTKKGSLKKKKGDHPTTACGDRRPPQRGREAPGRHLVAASPQ